MNQSYVILVGDTRNPGSLLVFDHVSSFMKYYDSNSLFGLPSEFSLSDEDVSQYDLVQIGYFTFSYRVILSF